uniref:Uncharacterized protein n=1 Tax=Gorilla gorilla gorilla TaxID=9595 RepID=A0A2I2YFR5_GORGO
MEGWDNSKALEGTDQTLDVEEEQEESKEAACGSKKRVVPGIVYLGHIPPHFQPLHARNLLSAYGEAEDWFVRRKKKAAAAVGGKKAFRDKRMAKSVAATLHNTPMGTHRCSPSHYDLWNLKYSHRFTWSHHSEHLDFERQRLRVEVTQAKCETIFYLQSVERGQCFLAVDGDLAHPDGSWTFAQRPTKQELRARKAAQPGGCEWAHLDKAHSNKALLGRIFGAPPPSESMEGSSLVRDS